MKRKAIEEYIDITTDDLVMEMYKSFDKFLKEYHVPLLDTDELSSNIIGYAGEWIDLLI